MKRTRSLVTVVIGGIALASTAASARSKTLVFDGKTELFMPDIVSTPYSEVRAAVSPDGSTVLWGSTDRPGGPGGWDIWLVRRVDGKWSAPTPAAFDTPKKEFDPAFSADGRTVYFFSDRPGGLGGDDIWRVAFDPHSGAFGEPENLGAAINSAGDEWAPSPSPDGKSLMFASNGRGGRGRHDIFISALRDGHWRAAQALPGEVNSAGDDFDAAFVAQGRAVVFARSNDADNDPIELWYALREGDRFVHATRLDTRVNVDGSWTLGPSSDPTHPGTLLFSARRSEAQRGKSDIYMIHYHLADQ